MQLKPFLLDAWLDQYEHDIEFNLAASTGPTWTVNDILALADDETHEAALIGEPNSFQSYAEEVFQRAVVLCWCGRYPNESYDYDRFWTNIIRYLGETRLRGTQQQVPSQSPH
jgi:hypothetical protein